jgi:hypothetical protein
MARRTDLLKMHAYRDAIHRSAGAYVLYPGDPSYGSESLQRYHEVLPGIGAFAMRPSADGHAESRTRATISEFLDDVLEHLADQSSSRERATFWADRSYVEPSGPAGAAVAFISQPPADTSVLLGFVRSDEHLDWVLTNGLYNLRADDRDGSVASDSVAVSTELVLLYGPALVRSLLWRRSGPPALMTADDLRQSGYPSPRGQLYCCLPIVQLDAFEGPQPGALAHAIDGFAQGSTMGAPLVVRWSDL